MDNKYSTNKINEIQQSVQYRIDLFIQSIKQWIMTLVNEASIGLFQIQIHLKETIILLRQNKNDSDKFIKKTLIIQDQQQHTIQELKQIGQLNKQWSSNMQNLIDKLQKQ